MIIYVDDKTLARLLQISKEDGRTPERLAEDAVAEAALQAFRARNDDPAATNVR